MDRKYLLQKSIKTAKLSRLMAKGIDLFIVLILSLFYPVGLILAIVYLAYSDSLQNGQSVGKRYMGFSVISLEDGTPCRLKQSIIRNLPFLIPLFFAIIPIWGWVISILTGIPLILLELYLLAKLDSGHRLGDVMADTTVMGNDVHRVRAKAKEKTSWFDVTEKA